MSQKPEIHAVRPSGPVRIALAASVANDLDALKKGITSLVERIGCRTCFSGADCRFSVERDFVIDAERKVHPAAVSQDLAFASARSLTVKLAPAVANNIEGVKGAVEAAVARLGCAPCCSGFDINFQQEIEFMEIAK